MAPKKKLSKRAPKRAADVGAKLAQSSVLSRIVFYDTPATLARLERAASESGLSFSSYMRGRETKLYKNRKPLADLNIL